MDSQNCEIDSRTGVTDFARKRHHENPAGAGAVRIGRAGNEKRDQEQRERSRQKPEADIVHAWERHIRRADHQRDKPIAEAADHRRHDHEENHDQAMSRDKDVIDSLVGEILEARLREFETHHH